MATSTWLIIIAILIVLWYMWSQYGAYYTAIHNNPNLVAAGQSIGRYYTDVTGLVNAVQSADSNDGSFTSRLGSFFAALPK